MILVFCKTIQILNLLNQCTWSVWWRNRVFLIFTVAFDRLGKVRLGQVRENGCLAGLEPPEVAKNRKKGSVKI